MTTTATKERPILFSGLMVQKILAGEKSQTRRAMKPQPTPIPSEPAKHWWPSNAVRSMIRIEDELCGDDPTMAPSFCPYGEVGDRLWVRETFARRLDVDPIVEVVKAQRYAIYRADGTSLDEPHWHSYPTRWTPAIHMPRWASRLTLEITEVRVERVGSISHPDIAAEGALDHWDPEFSRTPYCYGRDKQVFAQLWDCINGKRAGCSWDDNPWVWAITFRRITQ